MDGFQNAASQTQAVYERLRADLLACRLPPGRKLKINELCRSLSANLSAVREALSRLTAEELVVAEPQRGFRATPLSGAELVDLTRVRGEIEASCLRRAMAAGDVAWEARIVAAFHRLSRTPEGAPGDPQRLNDEWSAAHAAFHGEIVSSCGSPWLLRLRALLFAQSERYRRLSFPLSDTARDVAREHGEIVEAVLARDTECAISRMLAHFERTAAILLRQLSDGTVPRI